MKFWLLIFSILLISIALLGSTSYWDSIKEKWLEERVSLVVKKHFPMSKFTVHSFNAKTDFNPLDASNDPDLFIVTILFLAGPKPNLNLHESINKLDEDLKEQWPNIYSFNFNMKGKPYVLERVPDHHKNSSP